MARRAGIFVDAPPTLSRDARPLGEVELVDRTFYFGSCSGLARVWAWLIVPMFLPVPQSFHVSGRVYHDPSHSFPPLE